MRLTRRRFNHLLSMAAVPGAAGVLAGSLVGFTGLAQAQDRERQGVTDHEILLGAFGPLTGPAAWIGLSARDGLNLALKEINDHGGILGRRLRLIFENAQTPADSIAVAKKLVEQDRVFALIIGAGSTGAAAAADYVREVGIPTYNIVAATPKIRTPFARNIFNGVYPDASTVADAFAHEIDRTRPKHIGLVVGNYEFPQAVYRSLLPRLDKLGVGVAISQTFDLGTQDFTAPLVALARAKPDLIVFMGNAAEAGLAIKQAPELGVSGIPWVIDLAGISRSVPQVAGTNAEGVRSIWMFPYFHDEPSGPMAAFDRKWRAAYGRPAAGRPSYVDINGYGDMYVLALALRATGRDLSWDRLITTWENLKGLKPSAFGSYASDVIFPESFSPTDRDGNKRYSSVRVTNGVWRVEP